MSENIGTYQFDEDAGLAAEGASGGDACAAAYDVHGSVRESSLPRPGSEEFASACRSLDRRPLGYRLVKRLFDILFSVCAIALGLIPGVVLSILIALDTKGFPVYSQIRIGKDGRPFNIFKFRSMVADSDDVEKYFTPEQLEVWKRERKVDDDPRVTKFGKLLRKTSIDEFPQFLNVLLGQISIVGPRAVTYDELEHYGSKAFLLLSVPQGISGAWQCGPRNSATFKNGQRQAIELNYAQTACFANDLRIFLKTFSVMFAKRTGR